MERYYFTRYATIIAVYICLPSCELKTLKRERLEVDMCLNTFRSIPDAIKLNQSMYITFKQNFEFPYVNDVIRNLPEYVDHIVKSDQSSNCLVNIVNFENINLPQLNHPAIIRRPYFCLKQWFFPKYVVKIRSQNPLVLNKWTNYSDLFHPGSCTRFLKHDEYRHKFNPRCDLVDFFRLLGYVKPWRFELSLEIYPPVRLYYPRSMKLPQDMYHVFDSSGFEFLYKLFYYRYIPNGLFAVPFMHVLVTQHDIIVSGRSLYLRHFLDSWTWLLPKAVQGSHIFLMWITTPASGGTNADKIVSIKQVSPCFHCIPSPEIEMRDLNLTNLETGFNQHSFLFGGAYPPRNGRIHWQYRSFILPDAGYQAASIPLVLSKCGTVESLMFYRTQATQTSKDKLSLVYAKVILDVLRNYSFAKGASLTNESCMNGKVQLTAGRSRYRTEANLQILSEPTMGNQLSAYIENEINTLKFITCRVKGWHALAYGELLNPYRTIVWVIGITSGISVAYMIQMTSRRKMSLYRKLIPIFMAFTEQGDPFSLEAVKRNSAKLVIATYLLMTVVLSNAYKTTNVYNMILPQFPVLYKNVKQLNTDGFTIYVRGVLTNMKFFNYKRESPKPILKYVAPHDIRGGEYDITLTREIQLISELLFLSKISGKNEFYKDTKSYVQMTELLNKTRLHPNIFNWTIEVYNALNKSGSEDTRKLMETSEDKKLLQSLKTLETCAVIAPLAKVSKYLSSLKRYNVTTCHIGEDRFGKIGTGFKLVGLIPPYITLRLRIMQESGIWKWWERLVTAIETRDGAILQPERQEVKKATLDGNIIVIFTVVLVGNLLGILTFLLEFTRSKSCIGSISTKKITSGITSTFRRMRKEVAELVMRNIYSCCKNVTGRRRNWPKFKKRKRTRHIIG